MSHKILLSLVVAILLPGRILAAEPYIAVCPAHAVQTEQRDALMRALPHSQNAAEGRSLTRSLVRIYITAPNPRAQDMLNRGIALRKQKQHAESFAAFNALIGYCPSFAEGYYQRALAYRAAGQLDAALTDLNTALSQSPDHLGAMARKAQVLVALGRYHEGRALRAQVARLNPWLPDRLMQLELPGTPL